MTHRIRAGQRAPELALTDHRGQQVQLSALRGRTIVGPLRSTFVVAEDGAVASAEIDVSAEGRVDELYRRLQS